MRALLWFRRDLRLHDHPALAAAARDGAEVLACFVVDPRLEASSGRRRLQLVGDSLRRLRDDLDGRLLVNRGRPETPIPCIANEISASAVYISEDFAPYGVPRDERVCAALDSVPLVGRQHRVSLRRRRDASASRVRLHAQPGADDRRVVSGQGPSSAVDPSTQGERFDPAGDYIRRWVPELRAVNDAHLRKGERPHGYPAPIVDHGAERTEALRRYQSI